MTTLIFPERTQELDVVIQRRADQGHINPLLVPDLKEIDRAIESVLESLAYEDGHRMNPYNEEHWHTLQGHVVEWLGYDFDEIFEVTQ